MIFVDVKTLTTLMLFLEQARGHHASDQYSNIKLNLPKTRKWEAIL